MPALFSGHLNPRDILQHVPRMDGDASSTMGDAIGHLLTKRRGNSPTSPQNQGHDTAWIVRRCIYVFIALAGFAALCLVLRFYMRRDRERRRSGQPVVYGRNGKRWLKWHDQHKPEGNNNNRNVDEDADAVVHADEKHAEDRAAVAGVHDGTADMPEKPRPSHAKPTREAHFSQDPNPNSMLNV